MTIVITRLPKNESLAVSRYTGVVRLEAHRDKGIVSFTIEVSPEHYPLRYYGFKLTEVVALEVEK